MLLLQYVGTFHPPINPERLPVRSRISVPFCVICADARAVCNLLSCLKHNNGFNGYGNVQLFFSVPTYRPTDELLVALHHVTPAGRACICSWDPSSSGSVP